MVPNRRQSAPDHAVRDQSVTPDSLNHRFINRRRPPVDSVESDTHRRHSTTRAGLCRRPRARSISASITSGWLTRSSAVKPRRVQVDASHEGAALIVDLDLRFCRHLNRHVEEMKRALPPGLAARVCQRDGPSQPPYAGSRRRAHLGQLRVGDVAEPECHVEQGQVTSAPQQDLGGVVDGQALEPQLRGSTIETRADQAGPPRPVGMEGRGGEDRDVLGQLR